MDAFEVELKNNYPDSAHLNPDDWVKVFSSGKQLGIATVVNMNKEGYVMAICLNELENKNDYEYSLQPVRGSFGTEFYVGADVKI